MKRDDPRHGTYAGAQQHMKEGVRLCRACRDAYNAYMRDYRSSGKGLVDSRRYNAARHRALTRLAQDYPSKYRRLLAEELTQDGAA